MQQHAADLVAGKQLEVAMLVPHGHAQAVAVGVGGENHIGAHLIGQLDGQGERAGILGVGHLDGGKIRVRQLLLLHHGHIGNADFLQDAAHGHIAAAMQGRVDDGQVRALLRHQFRLDAQRSDLGDVVIIHFLIADDVEQPLGLGLVLIHQGAVGVGGGADKAGHAVGGLRAQLGAVLAVYLIAVVLGRIMAGSNHHACNGVQVAHRIGENRYRAQRVEQISGHALLAQHQRRVSGKLG